MSEVFHRFAKRASDAAGSPWAFIAALGIVIAWLLVGPLFRFSDTWQLTINTASSIVPTLMVFLIQNTQNRDAKVLHLKLDKLLSDLDGGASPFINLEALSDHDIDRIAQRLIGLAADRRQAPEGSGTPTPKLGPGTTPTEHR